MRKLLSRAGKVGNAVGALVEGIKRIEITIRKFNGKPDQNFLVFTPAGRKIRTLQDRNGIFPESREELILVL